MKRFSEQFQLNDLDRHAVSSLTSRWLVDRQENGFDDFKLHNISLTPKSLLLTFTATASYAAGHTVKNISVDGKEVNRNQYIAQLNFLNPEEFIGSSADFSEFSEHEQKTLIKDYLDEGMAKVHCTCPAYYYQGHFEAMASHDSDIYQFPGPAGTGVWRDRHSAGLSDNDITICKHLASVIEQVHMFDKEILLEVQSKDWGEPRQEKEIEEEPERESDDPEPVLDTPDMKDDEPEEDDPKTQPPED